MVVSKGFLSPWDAVGYIGEFISIMVLVMIKYYSYNVAKISNKCYGPFLDIKRFLKENNRLYARLFSKFFCFLLAVNLWVYVCLGFLLVCIF